MLSFHEQRKPSNTRNLELPSINILSESAHNEQNIHGDYLHTGYGGQPKLVNLLAKRSRTSKRLLEDCDQIIRVSLRFGR